MSQKNVLTGLGALALFAGTASADLIITEIVDGTLVGGLPKWVEITNTGPGTIDLAGYSIGNYNNGGTDLGGGLSLVLSGMLDPCESYVVNYDDNDAPGSSTFLTVYGTEPSNYDNGAFFNGDDVIALFLADGSGPNGEATGDGSDATLIDVYGTIGVDGTGQNWEYTDSYAQRLTTTASAVFNAADWTIAGVDALEAGCAGDDTCETTNHQSLTTPFDYPPATCGGPITPVCFGDGSGAPCGCLNESNGGSMSGCLNSVSVGGVGPMLSGSGSASVSSPNLTLDCSGVRTQPGLMFQGNNTIAGGSGQTFGDGVRCCGGGVLRLATINPPVGPEPVSVTFTVSTTPSGVTAGDKRCYQYWYRDPGGPCGANFNLSSAVTVTWQP